MSESEPRQHHILPAFYLAGFTDTGRRSGKTHVFDGVRAKTYLSSPDQILRERDYYKIFETNQDPYAVEKDMAELEGEIAPVFQSVAAAGKITGREQVGTLLSLATLITARDRRGRLQLSEGLRAKLKADLASQQIDEEGWQQIRASELRAGTNPHKLPTFEQAVRLARTSHWEPPAPRIFQVGMFAQIQRVLLDHLVNRPWEMMITESKANGGFVCSDSPLVWGSLDAMDGEELHVSIQEPDIEITFPVTKNLALISHKDARTANLTATNEIVAHINMRTVLLGMGMIVHAEPDFLLRRKPGDIAPGSEWIGYISDARRKGILRPW